MKIETPYTFFLKTDTERKHKKPILSPKNKAVKSLLPPYSYI